MKTKGVIYCGLFTALIAVGAFIKIPIPVVPFTLQYLFTMLAGLLLGPVNGALAVQDWERCLYFHTCCLGWLVFQFFRRAADCGMCLNPVLDISSDLQWVHL